MVSYVNIIGLCHSVTFLKNLPFQANANYGTWSIDFDEMHVQAYCNIYAIFPAKLIGRQQNKL